MPKVISEYTNDQIRQMAKHPQVTQMDIVKMLGVSRATVRAIGYGKRQIKRVDDKVRPSKDIWDVCPITGMK